MKEVLLATTNSGKIAEFNRLLRDLELKIISLDNIAAVPAPIEDGSTFEENAIIKASYYAIHGGIPAIADDSGLEVFSLGGRPGIFSARFAGSKASDEENVEKLLGCLKGKSGDKRDARFVCSIALASADESIIKVVSGECRGNIASKPNGNNGFGYDPVFIPEGYEDSFGVLSNETKETLSHRARAAKKLADFLALNSGLLT